ncbi:hypothetical protein SPRG_14096 [Saprolegnia parasitica CBS 223.65]|uniref:PPM-type phosphatase domain-containing protein n=1 Tax=Saprolegnia parasitica (strain CBS 223.65) TaxID=695850 RepID=A0A067BVK0_SAPPC|nr:hypothetical protein SPRG_14096 [Saprolegnia parasitica CBS 223.65]KDO20865.1 hypothetical protein SPRG_14096 [Saprolegnia parasitica CBS 223.65]|eukprot:XP_012208443.1 hypothetical protein SPRG_14096 [Saprolegnia parasitica CBS 223.65]
MASKCSDRPPAAETDLRQTDLDACTFISEEQHGDRKRGRSGENGHVHRHKRTHAHRRHPYARRSRSRSRSPQRPATRKRRRQQQHQKGKKREDEWFAMASDDAEDEGGNDDDDEAEEKTQDDGDETLAQMEKRLRPGAADLSIASELLHASESWQGAKPTNEDRVAHVLDMLPGPAFAIFDGHGGSASADFVMRNLLKNVSASMRQRGLPETQIKELLSGKHADRLKELKRKTEVLQYQQEQLEELVESNKKMDMYEISLMPSVYQDVLQTLADGRSALELAERAQTERAAKVERVYSQCFEKELFQKAMIEGFLFSDAELLRKQLDDGSTGLVAWFAGFRHECLRLILANVGDCRAVLCRNGKALALTQDHKPSRPDEAARIKRAGGYVGAVQGISRVCSAAGAGVSLNSRERTTYLSVSRSFGDRALKVPSNIVCADPEVRVVSIEPTDTFLVLACDGIWDVLSNQDVVDIGLEHFGHPKRAADAIVKRAYAAQSKDNLSAIVVYFGWRAEEAAAQWHAVQAERARPNSKESRPVALEEEAGLDMFSM